MKYFEKTAAGSLLKAMAGLSGKARKAAIAAHNKAVAKSGKFPNLNIKGTGVKAKPSPGRSYGHHGQPGSFDRDALEHVTHTITPGGKAVKIASKASDLLNKLRLGSDTGKQYNKSLKKLKELEAEILAQPELGKLMRDNRAIARGVKKRDKLTRGLHVKDTYGKTQDPQWPDSMVDEMIRPNTLKLASKKRLSKLIFRNDPALTRLAKGRKTLAKKRKAEFDLGRAGVAYFEQNKRFPGVLDIPAYIRHNQPNRAIKMIAKKHPIEFRNLETPAFIRKKIK